MKKLFIMLLIAATIFACKKGDDSDRGFVPDCSTSKSFANDVVPLLQTYCSGCHGSGSTTGPGALTTYAEVYPHRSKIRTAIANGTMPQGNTLIGSQKSAIICWIDSGAPNN